MMLGHLEGENEIIGVQVVLTLNQHQLWLHTGSLPQTVILQLTAKFHFLTLLKLRCCKAPSTFVVKEM